jgi:hypothetical protein
VSRGRTLWSLGVALVALLALGGCAREAYVKPLTLVGTSKGAVLTLTVPSAQQALIAAVPATLPGKPTAEKVGIRYGIGTPDDVAATVKNGRLIDLVVLPAGPALDRVSDELLQAPTLLGVLGSTRYYAGAVTARALPLVKYWEGPRGRAKLRSAGLR